MDNEKIVISFIRNYLNLSIERWTDEKIKERFPEALELALSNFNKLRAEGRPLGVVSVTQGSQSVTYSDTQINNLVIDGMVKGLLPRPFLKLY